MKTIKAAPFTSFTLAALLLVLLSALHAADVTNLRCEYRENPLGINVEKPRLSWKLETGSGQPERGVRQTAYQVLVASSEELLAKDRGDLWDSGKVASERSTQIEYSGKPLASHQPAYWKVKVWDTKGAIAVSKKNGVLVHGICRS